METKNLHDIQSSLTEVCTVEGTEAEQLTFRKVSAKECTVGEGKSDRWESMECVTSLQAALRQWCKNETY